MSETLFPGYEPDVAALPASADPSLSADRRRTLRQAEAIADGRHPLTGGPLHSLASRARDADAPKSDPFTCGSCYFRERLDYHNRTYAKCLAGDGARVSHGAASDVRAWWPACPDYSPGDSISPDAARTIPTPEPPAPAPHPAVRARAAMTEETA